MKVILKDGTEIRVTNVRFSKGNFGQYGYRCVLSIHGDEMRAVKDQNALKMKFRDDNVTEVRICREIDGVAEEGTLYNFVGLVDLSHLINDFEEKIDIILEQKSPQAGANE